MNPTRQQPTVDLKALVRDVPDFPKPGIIFRDLTPLMGDPFAFRTTISALARLVEVHQPEAVVGIEARGFIYGATVAAELGVGFVPVRKPGKLPWKIHGRRYELEYGIDSIEIHEDAVKAGARVVIVDDLLATGGTALAAFHLVRDIKATVVGMAFVIELALLRGRDRLGDIPVDSLIVYP